MGKSSIAIGAVLKDEGPYLVEWIAYWRSVGVSRFYLADNGGSDDTSSLLKRLHDAGIVTRLPWPKTTGNIQMSAYRRILKLFGRRVGWIIFVDGDEFVLLQPPLRTVRELIDAIGDDASAIGLNWAIYGSSGLADRDARLVTERFTMRADQAFPVNRHLKTFVRPSAVKQYFQPHTPRLRAGHTFVDSNGRPIDGSPLTSEVVWGRARINHYIVKSRAEFASKAARGNVTGGQAPDDGYLAAHDRNDVSDPMRPELIAATKREIERLQSLLKPTPLNRVRGLTRRLCLRFT